MGTDSLHFLGVHLPVAVEFITPSKCLRAELALVALLPGVDVAMPGQLVPLGKGLRAELARVAAAGQFLVAVGGAAVNADADSDAGCHPSTPSGRR